MIFVNDDPSVIFAIEPSVAALPAAAPPLALTIFSQPKNIAAIELPEIPQSPTLAEVPAAAVSENRQGLRL